MRPKQHQAVINDAAFSTMVGMAAEYNSACVNTLRRSLDGCKHPSCQRNLVAVLLRNREFAMTEIPEQETEKEVSFEEKSTQIDQNNPIKQKPLWHEILHFIGKNAFLIFTKILEYFVNRARFGLMAVCTFNIILIALVFSEWFIYFTFFTIFLPNSIRDLLQIL